MSAPLTPRESRLKFRTLLVVASIVSSALGADEDLREKSVRLTNKLKEYRQAHAGNSDEVQKVRKELASTLRRLGKPTQAFRLYKKVESAYAEVRPRDHIDLLDTRVRIALCLHDLRKYEKARDIFKHAIERLQKKYTADNSYLLWVQTRLALALHALEDYKAAYPIYKHIYETNVESRPERPMDVVEAGLNFGAVSVEVGKNEEGCALLNDVVATLRKDYPERQEMLHFALHNLACGYMNLKRHEEAREILERLLREFSKKAPRDQGIHLQAMINLGQTLLDLGEIEDAREYAEEVIDTAFPIRKEYGHELDQARELLRDIKAKQRSRKKKAARSKKKE